jgi:glutaredoxin
VLVISTINFYTAEWCPDCRAAKRVLDLRNLKYKEIDIDQHPEYIDIIIEAMGKRVLPTIEYRGSFIDGNHFAQEKFEADLDKLLGKK